jgi:hypothetical protein
MKDLNDTCTNDMFEELFEIYVPFEDAQVHLALEEYFRTLSLDQD